MPLSWKLSDRVYFHLSQLAETVKIKSTFKDCAQTVGSSERKQQALLTFLCFLQTAECVSLIQKFHVTVKILWHIRYQICGMLFLILSSFLLYTARYVVYFCLQIFCQLWLCGYWSKQFFTDVIAVNSSENKTLYLLLVVGDIRKNFSWHKFPSAC